MDRCHPVLVRHIALSSLLAVIACAPPSETPTAGPTEAAEEPCAIRFADVTDDAGVDFLHFDSRREALLPEDNGSGVAFGDYDNDGYDDLYGVNLAGPALMDREELEATRSPGRLFHNEGDGTFRDVTESSGLRHVGWDQGALWVDLDDDGWLDLVLTGLDEVRLFTNSGDGTFEDTSEAAGLGPVTCAATGLTAGDFDRDGDLDLYIPCYVDFPWDRVATRAIVGGRPATMTTPANYPPQPNLLFVNDGQGRFAEAAAAAGVADETGRGLQSVFVDLDDDGWLDLYVANDQSFDRLFRNLGDGTFRDEAASAGTRDPRAGMGVGVGDYDLDGRLDLFLTHWVGEENALYRNLSADGFMLFEDLTFEEGLGPADPAWVSWGVGFFDFDRDRDLDLFMVNGSTIEDEWTLEVLTDPKMIPQRSRIYERRDGAFHDTSECAGPFFEELLVGRTAAFADYDRDGRPDAAVAVHNGRLRLLRNESEPRGHWLEVELVGAAPNRWAVGARVTVTVGDTALVRHRIAGEGYLSQSSAALPFGLGDATEAVRVEVRWPSGTVSELGPIPVDRRIRLREGEDGWEEVPAEPTASHPWGDHR